MILSKDTNGNVSYVNVTNEQLPYGYTALTQEETDTYNYNHKKQRLKLEVSNYANTVLFSGFNITLPDNTGTYTFKSDQESQENINGALTAISNNLILSGKWITKDGQILTGLTVNDYKAIGQGIVTHKETITFTEYAKTSDVDNMLEADIDIALADIATYWNLP